MRGFGQDDSRDSGAWDDTSAHADAGAGDPTNAEDPISGQDQSGPVHGDSWDDGDAWDDDWDDLDDEFALPADTAEFEALGDLDLGSPSTPSPLPPEDRIWRHPSELQFMTPPEPARRSVGLGAVTGIALGAGLVGALLAVVSLRVADDGPTVVLERQLEPAIGAAGEQPVSFAAADRMFTEAAETVTPAIALIESTGADRTTRGSAVAFRSGAGETAFMTKGHLVRGAERVQIVLFDGRELVGRVAGIDGRTDIATVTVATDDLDVALLGDLAPVVVGQQAIAVGSPRGDSGITSPTFGIISGLRRSIEGVDGLTLVDMIQTDAAITAGAAGGALVNRDGAVIGITTAVLTDDPSAIGVAFATPIDVAYDVAVQLLDHGRAEHAWIGITGRDAPNRTGVEVVALAESGPSSAAALGLGDVIVAVDGSTVTAMGDLTSILMRRDPGDLAALELSDGRLITIVCGSRPDDG